MTDSTKCYKFAPISPPIPSSGPGEFPSLRMERIPSLDSAGPAAMLSVTQRWQVRSDLSTPSLGISRRQSGGIPNPGRGSQLRNAAPGGARSEGRASITSCVLGAQRSITPPHTPADCRGLGPAASPCHPTPESGHPDLTPDPNNKPLAPTAAAAVAAAAADQATRPRCP